MADRRRPTYSGASGTSARAGNVDSPAGAAGLVEVVLVPDHRAGLRDVLLLIELIDKLGKSVRQSGCGLLKDYGHLVGVLSLGGRDWGCCNYRRTPLCRTAARVDGSENICNQRKQDARNG
jgi:hypothetical protein